jgi:hypothetical protein
MNVKDVWCEIVDWFQLAEGRFSEQAVVNVGMNLQVP